MSATTKAAPIDYSKSDESAVPRILGLGITFHALAWVAFLLRSYTRLFVVRSFGKDDLLMCLCMVGLSLCPVLFLILSSCRVCAVQE